VQLFGFGGRSPGLAATGVASPHAWESVYLNPAGLGRVANKHIFTGFVFGRFELRGIDRPIDDAMGFQAGLAVPIPFGGALAGRVGFGAGAVFPREITQRVRAPRPGVPYFALLESRAQTVVVQTAVGVRITHHLSVGAGIMALGAVRGRIDLDTDTVGRISAVSQTGLQTDMAPIAGATYRLRSNLDLGLTFRGASDSAYDVDVYSELDDEIPVIIPDIQLAGVSQYDPLTVAAEAAWRPRSNWTVTGQLAWERWSAFPSPTRNPVIGQPDRAPPDFHDTIVPRLAVEHTRGDLSLRAGYFFALSPAPEMTTDHALADNHRHVFTLGLGLARMLPHDSPIRVDIWAQLHALQPRTYEGMPAARTRGAIFVSGMTVELVLK
jgi:long-chain fatty acid transport protein